MVALLLQELRDSFKLKQYVLVSRVFMDPSAPVVAPTKKQKVVSVYLGLKYSVHAVLCSQLFFHVGQAAGRCHSLCSSRR